MTLQAQGDFSVNFASGAGAYDALLIPDDAVTSQQSDQIVYIVGSDGKVVLAKDVVADDKFLSGIGFYVKGVESKLPSGK